MPLETIHEGPRRVPDDVDAIQPDGCKRQRGQEQRDPPLGTHLRIQENLTVSPLKEMPSIMLPVWQTSDFFLIDKRFSLTLDNSTNKCLHK